jgi:tetratricopeptide (TPR) repeat protein
MPLTYAGDQVSVLIKDAENAFFDHENEFVNQEKEFIKSEFEKMSILDSASSVAGGAGVDSLNISDSLISYEESNLKGDLKNYFKACTLYIKGNADEISGDHQSALDKYKGSIELVKNTKYVKWSVFPYFYANKKSGLLKIKYEKWSEAALFLENCLTLKIKPGEFYLRSLLVRCYLKTKKLEKAFEILKYIEMKKPSFYSPEKCPDYEAFNFDRALCYFEKGVYEKSLEIFRSIAKSNINVTEKSRCASVFYCARSHEELGNISEARLNYQWMISYYNTQENEYFCSLARKRLEYLNDKFIKEESINYFING